MSRSAKRTVLAVAALLAVGSARAAHATATSPPWTPLGPFGGIVRTLSADPAHSGTVYATTPGGIFKTVDGGGSWKSIYIGIPASNVAVDPVHPATLYVAANGPILLKSTDGGVHWAPSASGLLPDPVFVPRQVAVDPALPSRLLLTYGFGLWRSADAGASWQPANTGLPADSTTTYDIVWASPAGMAFVATPGGVYRSTDGGLSWHPASGLPALAAEALAVAPSNPRTVYADFGSSGLFRSADGGASWQLATAAAPASLALVVAPHAPATLYSSSGAVISRSTDSGAHWSPLAGSPHAQALAGDAGAGAVVYAGSSNGPLAGAFRSGDGGTTWTRQSRGISAVATYTLAVDPAAPARLWTSTGFVFRSENRGGGWIRVPAAPFLDSTARLAIGAASKVFANCPLFVSPGGLIHVLCSTADEGATWQISLPAPGFDTRLFRVAPSDLSTVYAEGLDLGGELALYRSTDDGATWELRASGSPPLPHCSVRDLAVAPSTAAVVYLAGGCSASVLRSTDGGATWTGASTGLPFAIAGTLAVDPRDSAVVYVGTGTQVDRGDGVWKSTDGGQTWSRAGAELAGRSVVALLASSLPGRLYAATGDGRVFRSDDAGASWQGWSLGLHAGTIDSLVADPSDPSRIYAATSNGVWTLVEGD